MEKRVMTKIVNCIFRVLAGVLLIIAGYSTQALAADALMTEPILQNACDDSVIVEWFTDSEGSNHKILLYGNGSAGLPTRVIKADTTRLSRLRGGTTSATCEQASVDAGIWKHVVTVDRLPEYHGKDSERILYKVVSDGRSSGMYTLAAAPAPGTPIKVLLTSDMQLKDMCAANIQKMYETVGRVDAVFLNGDIVDVSDRAYDWFYSDNAFFSVMTGKADHKVGSVNYHGAAVLQYAPVYTAIGNHDVMGVYNNEEGLSVQFNNPHTRKQAKSLFDTSDTTVSEEEFIRDHSYNTITYEEMFELPVSDKGGEKYYAKTVGDIRLIVLDVARVWRLPNLGLAGKYSEWPGAAESTYSNGDFIFEDVSAGSDQIAFLKKELAKDEYKNAGYRMVMFHSEAHSLGNNQIPPFTDPVATTVKDPVTGLNMVTYDYPIDKDYINTVIEPLLEQYDTDLEFNAHSHVWNRFKSASGMNILQTSNVGNTYGAYLDGKEKRSDYPSALNAGDNYYNIRSNWNADNYVKQGDPYGLKPVEPSKAKLPGDKPYLTSNTITSFSVLDTGRGCVDSYYFDTTKPDSDVILFDSFNIKK